MKIEQAIKQARIYLRLAIDNDAKVNAFKISKDLYFIKKKDRTKKEEEEFINKYLYS